MSGFDFTKAQALHDASYVRTAGAYGMTSATNMEYAYFGKPRSLEERMLGFLTEAARYMKHAEALAAQIAEENR